MYLHAQLKIHTLMENIQLIVIASAVGVAILAFLMYKTAKIFGGADGLDESEFKRMLGSFTFLGLTIFIIIMEAFRDHEYYLFGPFYSLMIIGGFLSTIGEAKFLETLRDILSSMSDLKNKKSS